MPLEIKIAEGPASYLDTFVVTPVGDITLKGHLSDEFYTRMLALGTNIDILFDASQISAIDIEGGRRIAMVSNHFRKNGRQFKMFGAAACVTKTLSATQRDTTIESYASQDDALASIGPSRGVFRIDHLPQGATL